jgi:hypothetical protein
MRVERDAELGLLGGRLPVVRVDLGEVSRDRRPVPHRLVQAAVEADALA